LRLRARLRRLRPSALGAFSRTKPLSEQYGWDRGTLIDRFFIESFLAEHRDDIRGVVVEIADRNYTIRFGRNVDRSEVLDIRPTNQNATIVADLCNADRVATGSFDCVILTQTLQFIFDLGAAVSEVHRILRPGGVVLATFPGIQRVGRSHLDSDYWRLTVASARALFAEVFGEEQVRVSAYGNLATSLAFLRGMALEEVPRRIRQSHDPFFATTLAVRAQRTV
jgi:SAM-dependent methyltransferase